MADDPLVQDPLAQVPLVQDPFSQDQAGDDAFVAGAAGADPATDPAAQKNPLDVLEELLKESQAKVGGGSMPGMPGDPGAAAEPAGPTPEQLQLQAEYEEKLRQQAILDQQALEQKRAELEEIKHTPQYQARVQQDQEKADVQQAKSSAGQGFDIKQLEHTKI